MKKRAFTLAEVLIVLTIVGFLFTLSLPNLIQKQGSVKFIESAKTAQEKLQYAFEMTAKKYEGSNPLDWPSVRESANKSDAIVKELANYIQVMSFCGNSDKGCFAPEGYRTLNGVKTNVITDPMEPIARFYTDEEIADKFNEAYIAEEDDSQENQSIEYRQADPEHSSTYINFLDGGSAVIKTASTKCNGVLPSTDTLERQLCGVIYVDINGQAIPNMLGVDVFGFYMSGNNVLPMGFYGDQSSFDYYCLRETPKASKYNGLGCSAWALKNKNMEYRKCQAGSRLGWTTSTRCDVPPKQ